MSARSSQQWLVSFSEWASELIYGKRSLSCELREQGEIEREFGHGLGRLEDEETSIKLRARCQDTEGIEWEVAEKKVLENGPGSRTSI